jgi:DNA-binding NtrC family response regulator
MAFCYTRCNERRIGPGEQLFDIFMPRVLIVDRESAARALMERQPGSDLIIEAASSVKAALDKHSQCFYDIVVWNTISAPSECINPVRIVKKFLKNRVASKAIVLSPAKEPEILRALGIPCEWLIQPVDDFELLAQIKKMVRYEAIENGRSTTTPGVVVPFEFEGILAFTLKMQLVIKYILEAAAQDIPVLITGETGTGKDLVAAAIHKRSPRSSYPYLPVNMGAIAPELVASELFGHERGAYTGASDRRTGLFEQAQSGTLFLDEITTMDEKTQVSLLRVLETKTIRRVRGEKDIQVDVRVIAATNENLEEAVRKGRFREDLFYRLDVFRIQLPPLRERFGALSLLTDHFVALFAQQYKKDVRIVSSDTYRLIRTYSWPGNIRELKNVIQRAVLLAKGSEITPDLLPERIHEVSGSGAARHQERSEYSPIQVGMSLDEVEREYIRMVLFAVNGNKAKAASLLKVSRRTLYNKLKRCGLS